MPKIALCIPARNEAARLPATLAAIAALRVPGGATFALCLLMDDCTDASEQVAIDCAGTSRYRVHIGRATGGQPNAGKARQRAMELGIRHADPDVLLTTDADSLPRSDWVDTMLQALDRAEIVTGKVERIVSRPNPMQDRVEAYYDRLFAWRRALDPVAWEAPRTHHCTGGANMGFRTAAYRLLGGFPSLPTGEDARIVDDAGRAGLRVRRDADCVVRTSDRRSGRTNGGLAAALRELDEGADIRVAHPADAGWQYRCHAVARRSFEDGRPEGCAADLNLTVDVVRAVAGDSPNAEAFAMRVVPEPPGGMRTLPFAAAEAVLDGLTVHRPETGR